MNAATQSFTFHAQTAAGEAVSGAIDAGSLDDASRQLAAMQLRVIQIDAAAAKRTKPLRGGDFQSFNSQLAHLTAAGLPVERSLRLIAQDMRTGRLANTVQQIAGEMESGRSLSEAFEQHANQFPPLYGKLVAAGVRGNDLPGALLNLGRHLELVAKMRAAVWRAVSYPLFVLISLIAVMAFLFVEVFPQFVRTFRDFHVQLPVITELVISISGAMVQVWPASVVAVIALVICLPFLWMLLQRAGYSQFILELFVFPLPLVGTALRRNLLARWCDALQLGVTAGLALPAAIELAGDAVGSPAMRRQGRRLIDGLNSGQPLEQIPTSRMLPATVTASIAFAANTQNLPTALETLSEMFQQQAEIKTALIPIILTPALVVLIAVIIATVVIAMFAPLISFIQAV